jgi:hypothetical protein
MVTSQSEKALRISGGPFREPEGSCLCEKEKLGPSEWPQSDLNRYYFFFFAAAFFFAGAFFFAFDFVAFFFIGMLASLLRSVARFEPLSSQARSTSATHHPYGADYMEPSPSGQQTNAILEIFF